MSVQALAAVLESETRTTGVDRLVLLALANHANELLECWPSHETLAREANAHVDTVRKSLRRLDDLGLVDRRTNAAPDSRIPTDRRPNLYRLRLEREGRDVLPAGGTDRRDGRDGSSGTGGTRRPTKPSGNHQRTARRPDPGEQTRPIPPPIEELRGAFGDPKHRDRSASRIRKVRSSMIGNPT